MHWNEHSPFLSTNSASSFIGIISGNGSAPNSMQPNQNMVSPSFPRSRYGLPTFSTKKGIGCTSGQNLLAPSHQCNHGPTWIALSFFAFYNCLCYHASTKTSISRGTCYIAIKYLALNYGFWTLSLVLSLSIGSTGAWVWVYILYTGAWVWVYILLASSRAIGQRYSLRQIQKVSRYCLCVLPSAFTGDEKITQL